MENLKKKNWKGSVGMNDEDIETLEDLIKKCDECNLNECINCEISWTQVQSIKKVHLSYKQLKEIAELKEENRTQRSQLNSAFSNGFIHKSKIEEILNKTEIQNYNELVNMFLKIKELLESE